MKAKDRGNFYLQKPSFQFCRFIKGIEVRKNTKFQFSISEMMPVKP